MSAIKFYVELGATDAHLDTLINVLTAMKSGPQKIKGAQISEVHSDEAKKIKPAKEVAPAAEAEETKAETPKAGKGITLDAIREVVAEKRKEHLQAMKDQLKNIHGVDNINKLAEKDYLDFYNYINSL